MRGLWRELTSRLLDDGYLPIPELEFETTPLEHDDCTLHAGLWTFRVRCDSVLMVELTLGTLRWSGLMGLASSILDRVEVSLFP